MKETGIKCVVWDLDNTLWRGILLEGDDLVLKPGVRALIVELDKRGIVHSIASKNDYHAAWDKLTAFGLAEYFLHAQINWTNKSESIKAIAHSLGISLHTFAFVDDEAFERDEVNRFAPEVTTVDAADIDTLLDLTRAQARSITRESATRRRMLQTDILRNELKKTFIGTDAEFLKTLRMCLTIRPATEADLVRAEELTARTNQLNTTGCAYSQQELSTLLKSSSHLLLVADLEDRYGTYGTIGLALIQQKTETWRLKLLLISCRVITRGVGGIIISHVLRCAKRHGVKLQADFVSNDRNRMMYATYKFNGFYEVEARDRHVILEHDLAKIRPYPDHVMVRAAATNSKHPAIYPEFL